MQPRRNVDIPALVAGIAIVALGLLLLLDAADAINLGFGFFWPALIATIGVILLASGVSRGR